MNRQELLERMGSAATDSEAVEMEKLMAGQGVTPDDLSDSEFFGLVAQAVTNARITALETQRDDLLEACIAALNGIGGDDASQADALAKVRAAIAKATEVKP